MDVVMVDGLAKMEGESWLSHSSLASKDRI